MQKDPVISTYYAKLSLSLSLIRCHAACEEWEEVLALLGSPDDQLPGESPPPAAAAPDISVPSLSDINSAVLVLKATAHEGVGDLPSAIECYKQVKIRSYS